MPDALPCPWCGKPAKVIDGEWAICSTTDDPWAEACAGEQFEVGVPLRLWNKRATTPAEAFLLRAIDDHRSQPWARLYRAEYDRMRVEWAQKETPGAGPGGGG